MIDTIQEIYGSLKRNKMRTIATGFAVASGLFLVIVLQGAGNGLIHSFQYNMGNFAFDAVNVYGGRTTKPFDGIKEGRFIQLDERDVNMTKKTFSSRVNDALPVVGQEGVIVSHHDKHISSSLSGVYPKYSELQAVKILKGRFVNQIDIDQQRKSIVIGHKTVEQLFRKNVEPLNQIVNINGLSYRVVGIYKSDEMMSNSEMYVPFTTLSTICSKGKFIDQITMSIKNIPTTEEMDTFMADYTRASSMIHTFAPDDRNALWIWNQAQDKMQMDTAMNILRNSFWILGLLTMISGVVGVSNIMLISVKERTREFGIRRAIGARPWNIIRMVMLESIIVTGIFGYIGMFFGIVFCEWMDSTVGNQTMDLGFAQTKYFVDPTVDLSTCVVATVIIVIAGAFAGFFPARKAVKIKPIDALRA